MKRSYHICLTVLFCGAVLLGAVLFWCLPDRDFSVGEKRSLQTCPRFDAAGLASGELSRDVNDYFADQFPARDFFVGVKGLCELASGKGENNGILLGKDGQLARRLFDVMRADGTLYTDTDYIDPAHIAGAANGIARALDAAKVPTVVLLPPRTLDVAADAFGYPTSGAEISKILSKNIGNRAGYLDMLATYRARCAAGEYVYYKTDHHWTARGAYYAYVEIMRAYGLESEILPESAFKKRTVTADFYGTFYAAGGMHFVQPDKMEIWYRGNEADFEVVADGIRLDSMYSMERMALDPYSVLLDGTHDVVTVSHTGNTRPRLLIAKDSFANALAPFLAQHFDLILLNLSSTRRDFTNLTALAEEYRADAALVVYTIGNVISTDRMNRLQ